MGPVSRRNRPLALAVALLLAAAAGLAGPPAADARDDERSRIRVSARCGTSGTGVLIARGDGRWIRVDAALRARGTRARRARWRVSVVHEGRLVRRTRVRARAGRVRVRLRVRDWAGPDRLRVRATSPWGEVCEASGLLVPERDGRGREDRDDDVRGS